MNDGWYRDCPVCGYPDDENCMCDDDNFADDSRLEDEEARERLREEDEFLYGIGTAA